MDTFVAVQYQKNFCIVWEEGQRNLKKALVIIIKIRTQTVFD